MRGRMPNTWPISPGASHWAGSARPRTSRSRRCFSPRTWRATSPASRCRSMAAISPASPSRLFEKGESMRTGVYRFPPMDSVIYGRPFAEALKEQVEESGADSVFLLASGTLNRETDLVGEVRRALGNRLAGVHAKSGAATPRSDGGEAANGARTAGADLLVTLGGGSVTDAAKMVAFCLGNGVSEQIGRAHV